MTTEIVNHSKKPSSNIRLVRVDEYMALIAGWKAAEDAVSFNLYPINSVLSLRGILPNWVRDDPRRIPGMALRVVDGVTPPPIMYEVACQWLDYMTDCEDGGVPLVCCWMGQSRSVAMVTTWMALRLGIDFDEALEIVASQYPPAQVHVALAKGAREFLEQKRSKHP